MSRNASNRAKSQEGLGRDAIVDAAFELMEKAGFDGFNMRGLAKELGVQAPTIYWHAGDKGEIIRLMAAEIYGEAYESVAETGDWRDWLLSFGRAFRVSLAKRKDSARICVSASQPVEDAPARAEKITKALVDAGLDRNTALSRLAAIMSFTLGLACYEQSEAVRLHLEAMVDFDEVFESGLQALVRGF